MSASPGMQVTSTKTSSGSLCRLDKAAVRYEGTESWVPQAVNLQINAGEIVALIGPSGCGKSSISLTVNGLVPNSVPSAYRGSVLTIGREVADASIAELSLEVAMVLQDPDAQIVTTRVFDEVSFALENLCLTPDEIRQRVTEALQEVGLVKYAEYDPWQLSGGQRQRLVLACALAMRPKLLVLDEPTANIDPDNAERIYRSVIASARAGLGVLLIEHDLDQIIDAVDRVVAIDSTGATLAQGTPSEVFYDHTRALTDAGIWLPTVAGLAQRFAVLAAARTLNFDRALAVLSEAGVTGRQLLAGELSASRAGEQAAAHGLRVRGLSAEVAGHQILRDVDLDAAAGQITAIIGPNGAGKSTLLTTLAGLNRSCQIVEFAVDGQPLKLGRPNAVIGYVFQNPQHQFLHTEVDSELAHSWRIEGASEAETAAQVSQLLSTFALTKVRDHSPFELSGGQQRRLSVASVLGEQRQVLCFDEPTFGQDEASAANLVKLIEAQAAQSKTIIIVTHDMTLVAQHAHRVVVLSAGRVVASGTAAEIFADDAALAAGVRPPTVYQMAAALDDTPSPNPARTIDPDPPLRRPPDLLDVMLAKLDLRNHLGPLTTFLAIIPALAVVLGSTTPSLGLGLIGVLSLAVILACGRRPSRTILAVLIVWLLVALLTWSSSFSYREDLFGVGEQVQILGFWVDSKRWEASLTLGVRIGALLLLVGFSGATSSPPELLRAITKYFKLPVRIAYAGVASISFMRRFAAEHRIIMAARSLRGSRVKMPVAAGFERWFGSLVPLLISAVRHAEKVSMAMDSRAFGAHRRRTELSEVRWRWADTLFVLLAWLGLGLLVWTLHLLGLLGEIDYGRYLHGG